MLHTFSGGPWLEHGGKAEREIELKERSRDSHRVCYKCSEAGKYANMEEFIGL